MTLKDKQFIQAIFNAGYQAGQKEAKNKKAGHLERTQVNCFYSWLEDYDNVNFLEKTLETIKGAGEPIF